MSMTHGTTWTGAALLAMALASAPALARTADQKAPMSAGTLTAADRAFMTEAAQGGLAEVALGKVAASQAADDGVKQFGQRMVDDHGKANGELKSLASEKGVELPAEPNAKQKATQARLEKMQGAAFDRAYVQDMLADHKHDVAAFEKAAKSAGDADLKAWAAKTLPTLKEHLQLVQQLASKGSAGKMSSPKTPE
jgi:putative membrane protein